MSFEEGGKDHWKVQVREGYDGKPCYDLKKTLEMHWKICVDEGVNLE